MSILAIVPLTMSKSFKTTHQEWLRESGLDVGILLIHTLRHWQHLSEMSPLEVLDVIEPTMTRALNTRVERLPFEEFLEALRIFRDVMYLIHNTLNPSLEPLTQMMQRSGGDVELQLKRWLSGGYPVIEIATAEDKN